MISNLYLFQFPNQQNNKVILQHFIGVFPTIRLVVPYIIFQCILTMNISMIYLPNSRDRCLQVQLLNNFDAIKLSTDQNRNFMFFNCRRESGISRVLGSMTKLFGKNIARSTDLLFLKTLVGSNSCIRHEKAILVSLIPVLIFVSSFLFLHRFYKSAPCLLMGTLPESWLCCSENLQCFMLIQVLLCRYRKGRKGSKISLF